MIVVADTSPLNCLIQIDCDHLLPKLYGRIVLPGEVLRELEHAGAPEAVRLWLRDIQSWIVVSSCDRPPEPGLAFLGPGEREAIQLAEEQHADLLLIDERKGRQEAVRRGLRTTGTLGVLLAAGELGLTDPVAAYRRLAAETTFRTFPMLEAQFVTQALRRT